MSRKDQANALWNDEVREMGLPEAIHDRLKFHNALFLKEVANFTGCATITAKKHLDRLVALGVASKELDRDDWLYKAVKT